MRFRRIKAGQRVVLDEQEYVVLKVYSAYARCKSLKTGKTECFTFGDFVMQGLENGQLQ